jgi:hypothetical protein
MHARVRLGGYFSLKKVLMFYRAAAAAIKYAEVLSNDAEICTAHIRRRLPPFTLHKLKARTYGKATLEFYYKQKFYSVGW